MFGWHRRSYDPPLPPLLIAYIVFLAFVVMLIRDHVDELTLMVVLIGGIVLEVVLTLVVRQIMRWSKRRAKEQAIRSLNESELIHSHPEWSGWLSSHPYGHFIAALYERLHHEFADRIVFLPVDDRCYVDLSRPIASILVVHGGGVDCIHLLDLIGPLVGEEQEDLWSLYRNNGSNRYVRADASWSLLVRKECCANPVVFQRERAQRCQERLGCDVTPVVMFSDRMNAVLPGYVKNPKGIVFLNDYVRSLKEATVRLNPFEMMEIVKKIKQ